MNQRGFTLVELMVALLIFGMIAAAGVSLLSFSVTAQAAASERLGEMAVLRRVSSLLTADLAQATPRITRDERGDVQPAFVGNDGATGELLFGLVRGGWSNFDNAPRASLQKIEYRLVGGSIERRSYPMLDGSIAGSPAVLIDDIESLSLRYRDKDGWRDRWDSAKPDAMPRAVELVVRRASEPEMRLLFLVGAGR